MKRLQQTTKYFSVPEMGLMLALIILLLVLLHSYTDAAEAEETALKEMTLVDAGLKAEQDGQWAVHDDCPSGIRASALNSCLSATRINLRALFGLPWM